MMLTVTASAAEIDEGLWPYGAPKYETRAVWLTTLNGLDWPYVHARTSFSIKSQKDELCHILDQLQQANINTVLFQVRIRGTVLYPSALEPWDNCLAGSVGLSPGYDPLRFAIDECHKRGMELHAWVVAIPVGRWGTEGCRQLRSKYPKMVKNVGGTGYLDPAYPGTADYLARLCGEITANYDIDGIHLDYIRYSEKWPMEGRTKKGRRIAGVSRSQARADLTRVVRHIHDTVKALKPWVKMSCAAVGKYEDLSRYSSKGWNAYSKVCQDAQGWLREGLMDMLFPMMYFRGDQFYPFAFNWQENDYGREIVSGLGIYFLSPDQSPKGKAWHIMDVERQLWFLRQEHIGQAFFRSQYLTDNTKGLYDIVCERINPYPALTPPMTWTSAATPDAPKRLDVTRSSIGDSLVWGAQKGDILYNVYASTSYPVDISDARNIVAVKVRGNGILIPARHQPLELNYAVTAVNRYGMESRPRHSPPTEGTETWDDDGAPSDISLLANDGQWLDVPQITNITDADYLIIETLQGTMMASRANRGNAIDISRLPEGMYQLRATGRKGAPHRIGFFTIRRK